MARSAGDRRRDLVRFQVPLHGRYVGLVRGVAATVVAAMPEIDEERIDDIRVAVSEACTLVGATEAGGGAGALVLTCAVDEGWLRVEVSSTGEPAVPGDAPPADDGRDPAWGTRLLEALVDEVAVGADGGRPTVSLGVRAAARRPQDPTP